MKTQFIVKGYIAFSEQDNFKGGCIGKTKQESMPENAWTNKANSFNDLLDMLSDEFKSNDFMLNSCEENGRLDLQCQQRIPFKTGKPSKETLADWKDGKINLWLTTYIFKVEIVQSEIDLTQYTDRSYN